MDFRARYQKELDHLLLAGQSFSKVHTQARHLAERSGDPDVERLLEGFAFLSAKVQARIDAGAPELIHHLSELLAPAQLRPIPACTMLEFSSDPSLGRELVELPTHTTICSEEVQGLSLKFRTTRPLTILPMVIEHCELQAHSERTCKLVLGLQGTPAMANQLAELGHLDLFVDGGNEQACNLYHAMLSHCERLDVKTTDGQMGIDRPRIQELGFDQDTPLLPWPKQARQGQRTLAEYFTLPEKFRQLRITGLEKLSAFGQSSTLTFVFYLETRAGTLGVVRKNALKLHVSPAINLFHCDAEPITQDCIAGPQRIRAAGHRIDQFELYEAKSLTHTIVGRAQRTRLPALFSSFAPPQGPSYVIERRPSQVDQRSDCFVRVLNPQRSLEAARAVVSMELLCSHRNLPSELRLGQINRFEHPVATQLRVHNLCLPSQSSPAPLHGELQWQLFSLLAAARSARPSIDQLKGLLWSYNHQARLRSNQGQANQQLSDALRSVDTIPFTGLVEGIPTRGMANKIELDEQELSDGQIYLFGRVLHALLSDSVALNTLNRSELHLHPSGRSLTWCPRSRTPPRLQGSV